MNTNMNKIQPSQCFKKKKNSPNKLRKEGNFLNLIKDIYVNLTANIILNSGILNAFSLRSEKR